MGSRRKGRELALQALYLEDVAKVPLEKAIHSVLYGEKKDEKMRAFAETLALGTQAQKSELDRLIVRNTRNWELSRMAAIDRSLLRLGTYELLNELETPVSVIIDEAVEIAKSFSTDDSGKFVNGILDKIKEERRKKNGASCEQK